MQVPAEGASRQRRGRPSATVAKAQFYTVEGLGRGLRRRKFSKLTIHLEIVSLSLLEHTHIGEREELEVLNPLKCILITLNHINIQHNKNNYE